MLSRQTCVGLIRLTTQKRENAIFIRFGGNKGSCCHSDLDWRNEFSRVFNGDNFSVGVILNINKEHINVFKLKWGADKQDIFKL